MISACYLTALGALIWLLVRRAVDGCDERGESRLSCHFARNSEEFIAHFTLMAAMIALASIVVVIAAGLGMAPAGFLHSLQAFLDSTRAWLDAAGLSVRTTAAILIGAYLVHLLRFPQDVELNRLPRALEYLRKPAPLPRMRRVLHTGLYTFLLVTVSGAFFASQTGSFTEMISMGLAEARATGAQRPAAREQMTKVAEQERVAPAQSLPRAEEKVLIGRSDPPAVETPPAPLPPAVAESAKQPSGPIVSPSISGAAETQERQRMQQERKSANRRQDDLDTLAGFRIHATERFKGVELAVTDKPDTATRDRPAREEPVRTGYAAGQRPAYYYYQPNYYLPGQGFIGANGQQGLQYRYPVPQTSAPRQLASSEPVEERTLTAARLIDSIHSDLQRIEDPVKQREAIAAANKLFSRTPANEYEFVVRVREFVSVHLPAGRASELVSSATQPRATSSAPGAKAALPTRTPQPVYHWHVPPIYQPGVRPPR